MGRRDDVIVLERSRELAALAAAARDAAGGDGSVALVHGEAGIGKSTVVRALRAGLPSQARLLTGYCDALSTPRALGPFKDVASALGDAALAAVTAGHRDAVMAATYDSLASGPPTVFVVEDVHWADEATLDTLRFLARRIDQLPVMLVLTYRDELDRAHPLTPLLGDLGHRSGVLRLPLRRLSVAAVGQLSSGSSLDPRTVHDLSSGNPYLVTELLASAGHGGAAPATVVDGVLGRLRLLPTATQDVVEQLAVLPAAVPRSLVDELCPSGWPLLGQAEARGLLVVAGGVVAFRHELTRRAVADALSGIRRSELNRVALRVLETQAPPDVSRLVHHAVEAGDDDAVVRHGPAAAEQAAASGAHREATSHYETVLEHDDRFPPLEQARLWQSYAVELYTVGDSARGVAAGERAVELWQHVDDPVGLARGLRWLSRLLWFAGRPADARVAAERATDAARDAGDESVLAMAFSNESQLAMLGDDHESAVPLAQQAIDIARRIGDGAVLSHALTNRGTTLFRLRGDSADARAALHEAIDVALRLDDHEDACRAYVNIAWSLVDLGEIDAAEPYARAGLEHAEKAEFITFWEYLLGLLARIALARGRWNEALDLVERATPADLPAWGVRLLIRATVAVRRGDADAAELLAKAWELASRQDELQRLVPVACATLEFAALTGIEPAVDATPVLRATSGIVYNLQAEELAWRLGATVPPDESGEPRPTSPYSLLVANRWRASAAEWQRLGWPYQQAEALSHSPEIDDQLAALDILDRLGAVPLAQHVRRRLREHGDVRVPRGPATVARNDPAGLTGRQQTVLALVADGLTNAEIADRLVVSVRTVDSHVAAVLAKLGVTTRQEAALLHLARAADLGTTAP